MALGRVWIWAPRKGSVTLDKTTPFNWGKSCRGTRRKPLTAAPQHLANGCISTVGSLVYTHGMVYTCGILPPTVFTSIYCRGPHLSLPSPSVHRKLREGVKRPVQLTAGMAGK